MLNSKQKSSKPSKSGFFHPLAWLLVFIIALMVGWTMFWNYAASKVEERVDLFIEDSVEKGTEITCANKEVRGFPFRIGLFCEDVSVANPYNGTIFSAAGLRSAAQIYAPNHLITELDAPARLETKLLGNYQFNWELMHASLKYGLSGLNEVAGEFLVSESFEELKDGSTNPDVKIDKGNFYMRSVEAEANSFDNLETAIDFKNISFLSPAFSSLPKLNIAAQGTYYGLGKAFEKSQLQHFDIKKAGLAGEMKFLRFAINDGDSETPNNGQFQIAGPWEVSKDGLLTADVTLTVSDIDALLAAIRKSSPKMLGMASGIAQGLKTFGKSVQLEGRDARALKLNIENGTIRVGFFELGKLPKLF